MIGWPLNSPLVRFLMNINNSKTEPLSFTFFSNALMAGAIPGQGARVKANSRAWQKYREVRRRIKEERPPTAGRSRLKHDLEEREGYIYPDSRGQSG